MGAHARLPSLIETLDRLVAGTTVEQLAAEHTTLSERRVQRHP
jgi:hypothetical protein